MASNPTPENPDILRALGDHMADGCHALEVILGIGQNTEVRMRAAIASVEAAEALVGNKKLALANAVTARQAADVAGEAVLTNCKLWLAKKLGQRWNAAWEPTGFPNQSTAIPDSEDGRFTLLNDLKKYFHDDATRASVDMEATEAICEAAWTALSDARFAEGAADTALTAAFDARTTATDALRKRVRGLISELEQLIPPDDARWETFGLNIPANPSAPEPVPTLVLTALGGGRFTAAWGYAVRAERYRIETLITGVDTEWQKKANAKDLEMILKGFTAGQVVKVRVVAINDGGEAAPSPEATVTVA
jgi:hypothetical protein